MEENMSSLRQEVVVLSAAQYDMVNKETGEVVQGTTVRYALTNTLAPFEENQLKGYKLAKTSLGFNNFHDFPEVPGVYECDLNFNINSDGVAKISAGNFAFKKSLVPAPAEKK